jgi:hypothetical protein
MRIKVYKVSTYVIYYLVLTTTSKERLIVNKETQAFYALICQPRDKKQRVTDIKFYISDQI